MKKGIIAVASLMAMALVGSGMNMSKNEVKADGNNMVSDVQKKSTVVGNLDIVKLYMNDYYN